MWNGGKLFSPRADNTQLMCPQRAASPKGSPKGQPVPAVSQRPGRTCCDTVLGPT